MFFSLRAADSANLTREQHILQSNTSSSDGHVEEEESKAHQRGCAEGRWGGRPTAEGRGTYGNGEEQQRGTAANGGEGQRRGTMRVLRRSRGEGLEEGRGKLGIWSCVPANGEKSPLSVINFEPNFLLCRQIFTIRTVRTCSVTPGITIIKIQIIQKMEIKVYICLVVLNEVCRTKIKCI